MERDTAREALVRSAVTELVSLAAFAVVFAVLAHGEAIRLAAIRLWGRRPGTTPVVPGWLLAEHARDVHDIAREPDLAGH